MGNSVLSFSLLEFTGLVIKVGVPKFLLHFGRQRLVPVNWRTISVLPDIITKKWSQPSDTSHILTSYDFLLQPWNKQLNSKLRVEFKVQVLVYQGIQVLHCSKLHAVVKVTFPLWAIYIITLNKVLVKPSFDWGALFVFIVVSFTRPYLRHGITSGDRLFQTNA